MATCDVASQVDGARSSQHALRYETPRRFAFVDDMPRSHAVNRVAKARLREMLAKGED